MKALLFIAALCLVITGCGWTPERSSPYDPLSSTYIPPAQKNRPPVFDTLIINTECINLPVDDDCGVIITAAISDSDGDHRISEVYATVEGFFFGRLSNDATSGLWTLRKQETELDTTAEWYEYKNVIVTAIDDSGAVAQRSITFPELFNSYPSTNWPQNFECVCPEYRNFSWHSWVGPGQARFYELRFYFEGTVYVPALTIDSIPIIDTTIFVPGEFEPSDADPVFYSWRVFVINLLGNSAGSEPKTFEYHTTCTENCVGP